MSIAMSPSTIPRLRGLPLLGNLLEVRYNFLMFLLRLSRECGSIGTFRVGSRTILYLNSPELVHAVLVEHAYDFEKTPNMRTYMSPMVGNGLLTSENEFHKRQRKLAAPAFQHRRIATYADTMVNYANRFQDQWTDGQTIDVAYEMKRLTLWIACKTLFDVDVLGEAEELGQALNTALRHIRSDYSDLVHISHRWPTRHNRRFREAIARLDATTYQIIAERREAGEERGDLLSMLLRAQDEDDGSFMSDIQLRDEVMTLILAGHETTANALAWTWSLLAQHPQVYAQVRDEVDRVLGERVPTVADLPYLSYTLQVFKEAMRLYPPAYVIARQAVRSVEIGGYHLPAGSVIMISPYTLHRLADSFPAPGRFVPERFAPGVEERLPHHAYLPFGDGPRICVGNHFALMEGHLILATLVQHVTFELVAKQHIEPEPLVTLRPRHGIKVIVRRN